MNRRDMLRASAALAASGGLRLPVTADEPKLTPADERIHKYLAAEVERVSKNVLAGATTKAEWEAKRPELRRQFLDMLGLDPLPEKTPLKATVTGTLDVDNVTVEKVHFQSRPGLYVTGNLYRPKSVGRGPPARALQKQHPAVLYLCGHANKGRDGNKTAYQDHPRWFASNGYVCLAVDTLQLGEVAGKHHGTYNLDRWWWHSRGYTPAGVECWNAVRALDYLVSRPDVDPDKLGVTGRSGGGATTVWVAAVDDRVKVAVPVSGMSDLEDYVTNRVINGHCDCMFGYNLYRWEWTTILALFAPKPLLFANDDADPIFPMGGNRRIAARLRRLYALLGRPDLIDEFVTPGKHDDSPPHKAAAFRFFNAHLKGERSKPFVPRYEPIAGKDLRVFPEDADLPKDAINATVDEVFVPKAEVKPPADAKDFPAWKAGLVKQLRGRCFGPWPAPAKDAGWVGEWEGGRRGYQTEPGMAVTLWQFRQVKGREAAPATLIVLNRDEDPQDAARFWAGRTADDFLTEAVAPRGCGPGQWARKNPPNTADRSLVLVGQTADAGRVYDVLALCDFHAGVRVGKGRTVRLVGRGEAGVVAAYAALLWGKPVEVVVADPPTSHRDGPHFLGVMRVLDVPDALGLLAPGIGLTLTGKSAEDPAFDRTEALYKLAGAGAKFKRG